MSAAINWLRNRGGYYSALEVAEAVGWSLTRAKKDLESALATGVVESREWQLGYTNASHKSYERTEAEPYRQYRVVKS